MTTMLFNAHCSNICDMLLIINTFALIAQTMSIIILVYLLHTKAMCGTVFTKDFTGNLKFILMLKCGTFVNLIFSS